MPSHTVLHHVTVSEYSINFHVLKLVPSSLDRYVASFEIPEHLEANLPI